MTSDAIVILRNDHQEIRKLFRDFRSAGENAHTQRKEIVDRILTALTVHTYLEDEAMYPRVRALVPALEQDILESYEEHHVADVLAIELAELGPEHPRFHAKTSVLIENVEHHMAEEENGWFPKVRAHLGRKKLLEIGAELIELKKTAPTSPTQPSALDKAIDAVIA